MASFAAFERSCGLEAIGGFDMPEHRVFGIIEPAGPDLNEADLP